MPTDNFHNCTEMNTMTDLEKFGAEIRTRRLALGLSQEDLADRSTLHRNYIGGVERGERNVSLKNILKLAQALAVSPSELLNCFDDLTQGATATGTDSC